MLELCEEMFAAFRNHLEEQERSRATIEKYVRDVRALAEFCGGEVREKAQLIAFKDELLARGYAVSSINSMLASINCFLGFSGKNEWKMRFLKVQRTLFTSREKEMTQKEYMRLVEEAERRGNKRLSMMLQTICSTGIRVSELRAITVENLKRGQARIESKGKIRMILIPRQLCRMLRDYCREKKIHSGQVFITKNGRPIDRSNLWKMMKQLASRAKINCRKVFPHNLRHLFACTYYKKYKDIVHLADILGHSSVNTTRIYTMKNAAEQIRQIDDLCLLNKQQTT